MALGAGLEPHPEEREPDARKGCQPLGGELVRCAHFRDEGSPSVTTIRRPSPKETRQGVVTLDTGSMQGLDVTHFSQIPLDVAQAYLRQKLQLGNAVAAGAREALDLSTGAAYSTDPPDYYRPATLAVHTVLSPPPGSDEPMSHDPIKVFFPFLKAYLDRDPGRLVLLEESTASSDSTRRLPERWGHIRWVSCGDHLYYPLQHGDDLAVIGHACEFTVNNWQALLFLSSLEEGEALPDQGEEVAEAWLRGAGQRSQGVAAAAYDGGGYVFWLRDS